MEAVAEKPYRSSDTRAKWAMAMVGIATTSVVILVSVVARGVTIIQNLDSTTVAEIDEWESSISGATGFYVLAVLMAAIAFLTWLHRVVANVPALGGGHPSVSPRAAVGWWFVPIANLFKPYQIVADVWKRLGGPSEQGTGLVLAWWLLWIGGLLVDRVIGAAPTPETLEAVSALLAVEFVALVAVAIAGGLLVRLIWDIERRCRARATATGAPTIPSAAIAPSPSVPSSAPVVPWSNASAPSPADRSGLAFCPNCGAARLGETRFCGRCGTDLEAVTQTQHT